MKIGLHDSDKTNFPNLALRARGVEVFAQPYRDFENKIEPTAEQRRFARWVNRKAIFKSTTLFSDYEGGKHEAT